MVLGVIPARGGSKGIPNKNLRPLLGRSLLAWTVEAARGAVLLDRFVVSTENASIAEAARKLGAEVLARPAELAQDDTTTLAVLQHALASFPAAETLVVLQPTSPVRAGGLVDDCIRRFRDARADSLATGFWCKYTEYGKPAVRRQDNPGFFYDDGNVYVIKADLARAGDRYGRRLEFFAVDREQNVDIDEEFDLWLAEKILERRLSAETR